MRWGYVTVTSAETWSRDAHLSALAIEHGTGICSFDSDFARFKDLRWVNPGRL
jgi:predicted nucleic acid-binding protein